MFNKVLSLLAMLISIVAICLVSLVKKDKVGYVYNSRVLSEYKGIVEAKAKYQQEINQWQANLDTLNAELRNEMAAYEGKREGMTVNERRLSEELINRKRQEFLNYKKALETKASERDMDMTKAILNQIDSYLLEYGKAHEYDYLFGVTDNGNILYANEGDDLTDEVIAELNKRYEGK